MYSSSSSWSPMSIGTGRVEASRSRSTARYDTTRLWISNSPTAIYTLEREPTTTMGSSSGGLPALFAEGPGMVAVGYALLDCADLGLYLLMTNRIGTKLLPDGLGRDHLFLGLPPT